MKLRAAKRPLAYIKKIRKNLNTFLFKKLVISLLGFKVGRVSPLLARARDVVNHFTRSPKETYKLRAAQRDGGKADAEVLEMVRDVPTRWTATYDMLTRLLTIVEYVQKVLSNSNVAATRALALTAEEQYCLRALCNALKPLCLAMQGMGGQTYCSVSLVAPLLHKLVTKHLVPLEEDTPVVYAFKAAAVKDLSARYKSQDVKAALGLATFLDPRFKEFRYLPEVEREEMHEVVVRDVQLAVAVMKQVSDVGVIADVAVQEPPLKRHKGEDDIMAFLNDDEQDNASTAHHRDDAAELLLELNNYKMELVHQTTDPIAFWKGVQSRYSLLAPLAARYLSIPATSVPSERLFSTAGLVVSKLRASLSPEMVANLLFLNKNADM
jgi:hypothetical protein